MAENNVQIHHLRSQPWRVTMLYTGPDTMTAGRIALAKSYIKNEPFLLTYGDGVADVNIEKLVDYHVKSGKVVTLTAVRPVGRYGVLEIQDDGTISQFREKPGDNWINGGFFVCENKAFDYIPVVSHDVMWEEAPLRTLAKDGQLQAYRHDGFWHPMDMLRDKNELDKMWISHYAPWDIWGHWAKRGYR